jgi:hypothetical protein
MQRDRAGYLAIFAVSLIVSACGGGGGGGTIPGGTGVVTTPFTSWRDDVAGKVIEAKGFGKQVSYTYDCGTSADCSSGKITTIGTESDTTVSALFFFDANGALTQLWPVSSVGFTSTQISDLNANFVTGRSDSGRTIVSDPQSLAWDYQSFGVWETGLGDANRTFGVMSVGAPTAGSAVPTTGTASFTGNVVGAYVDPTGQGHAVLADLTVGANFGTQTLTLSTTNSQISKDWTTFTSNTSLNLTGTLSYTAGTNTFSGTLSTSTLTGSSSGTFYGPAAQELGGVFYLVNPNNALETYAGAYGATTP